MPHDQHTMHPGEAAGVGGPFIELLTQAVPGDEAAGIPVLFHLATPSLPLPFIEMPSAMRQMVLPGIRPITYFRHGYAGTQARPGRTVADAAVEAIAVLDRWGVEKAVLYGGSGGGPHALACGARIPDRIAGIVLDSSPAPFELLGAGGFDGMNDLNRVGYAMAGTGRAAILAGMHAVFDPTVESDDPEGLIAAARDAIEKDGLPVGTSARYFADLLDENGEGWADDVIAITGPWGFGLADVRVPVHVMYGTRDGMTPPAHGRLLAAGLPDATADEYDGDHGALGSFSKTGDVIAALHRFGEGLA